MEVGNWIVREQDSSPVRRSEAPQKRTHMKFVLILFACAIAHSQASPARQHSTPSQNPSSQTGQQSASNNVDPQAEEELQKGTALTRQGSFAEAIPHLLAALGRVANEYAAGVNLAICYIATDQPRQAIPILNDLRASGHDNADVNNLLAQAYIGDAQDQKGFEALERAASLNPSNEKLYMFVADACMGKQAYALGLKVAAVGLQHLPDSAQLHFERGMFLSLLDQFDKARGDFELARELAPQSDIAFVAGAQEAMFEGNVDEAVRIAREGVKQGHENFLLLTLLGEALLRSGVAPGQSAFDEAQVALEKAVEERSNYPSSQLALGKIYLMENRLDDAVTHLEIAKRLNPGNPSVYSSLAVAYRRRGDLQNAESALATLAKLNAAQAEKIRSAPGDTKSSYAGGGVSQQQHQ